MSDSAVDINWYIDRRLVHEVHTSERKAFRGCRRRWDWFSRQRYYPKVTEKPLGFGIAYHEGLQAFYDPANQFVPADVRIELAIAAFRLKTNAQRNEILESGLKLDEEVNEDFDARIILGTGMLRYLAKSIAPQEAEKWTPVQVEVEFMVPIPHPETGVHMRCKCDICWEKWCKHHQLDKTDLSLYKEDWKGLPVVYAGRIDCLMEDEYGDLWIVDWKTAAQLSPSLAFLELDDQVGSYPWALWSIGMKVRGFIYAQQKKGFPQPPKENKNRRLGRLFSVAVGQDTDYETYKDTVSKLDPEAYKQGLYDQFLTYLKNENIKFFHREPVMKTDAEFAQLGMYLGEEVLDMLREDLYIYPSPGRGCERCAFWVPCVEQTRGGDHLYAINTLFEKKTPYYLREEPSTDK